MRYILFLILVLLPTTVIYGQEPNFIYGEQALTMDLEPAFPGPEQPYTVSLNDYSLPVQGAGIRWFIDGELLEGSSNKRTIDLTAPIIGQTTRIDVVLELSGGRTLSASRVVEPVYLDVIIEPQTRVPAFYRGRALPSIGSQINATALVNGNQIKPEELLYTWRVNNDTLGGGTLRGSNSVSFDMPRGKFATLSLEVRRARGGETLAKRLFDITRSDPLLHFYEKNILLGFSTKAVGETAALLGNELTIRAEPYYLDLRVYNQPDHLEWKIDNTVTPNPGSNPYEVILSRTSIGGSSAIGFHVRDLTQVLQGAEGSFRILGNQ